MIPRAVMLPLAALGVAAGLWLYHGAQVRSAYADGRQAGIGEQLTRQLEAQMQAQADLARIEAQNRALAVALQQEQARARRRAETERRDAVRSLDGGDVIALPSDFVRAIDPGDAADRPAP
jgi:hypothetical protein